MDPFPTMLLNQEAEQHVLGSILIDNGAFDRVADVVQASDFFSSDHRFMFEIVSRMLRDNKPVDVFTLHDELQRSGDRRWDEGLQSYIVALSANTPGVANVQRYAEIVKERSTLRRFHSVVTEIRDMLHSPMGRSAREIIDAAQEMLFSTSDSAQRSGGFKRLEVVLAVAIEKIDRLYNRDNPDEIVGVPSGFRSLDRLTGGFQPGDLVIVGGRPSMGKSAFALNVSEHVALAKKLPVGIFSLEMPEEQLATRELSSLARLNHFKLRKGMLSDSDWKNIGDTMPRLNEAEIYIDETSGITPMEIRARARRLLREKKKLGLIVVDYLQLMGGGGSGNENRATEIGMYSGALKNLAKELKCPVMALSQVNRGVESRPNKRPTMSDLRESGNIEQDADLILFLYRDEVYNPKSPDKGRAEVIIAKQRNGPLGTAYLDFVGETMRFENSAGAEL